MRPALPRDFLHYKNHAFFLGALNRIQGEFSQNHFWGLINPRPGGSLSHLRPGGGGVGGGGGSKWPRDLSKKN